MRLALCQAVREIAFARVLELPAEPPEWVDLIPVGETIDARDGRSWTLPDGEAVVAATRDRAGPTDLPIDYEHQAQRDTGAAPAAGWIKEVRVEGASIRGRVEWTERAANMIRAREYRYLSPAFLFDAATKRVKALVGAGLVNSPAFDLPALARTEHEPNSEIDSMNEEQLKSLREALGLAADADATAILAAVAVAASGNAALAKVAEKVGLAKDASGDDIVAAAHKAPEGGDFVPRAEYDRLAEKVNTLEADGAASTATAAVDAAVEAGKVSPATRDWALGYAKSDPDGFKAFVEAAPAIVSPGPSRTGGRAPSDPDAALTDEELATCRAMGISPDDFKAARKAQRDGAPPERKKPETE